MALFGTRPCFIDKNNEYTFQYAVDVEFKIDALKLKDELQRKFMEKFEDGFTVKKFREIFMEDLKNDPENPAFGGLTAEKYAHRIKQKEGLRA